MRRLVPVLLGGLSIGGAGCSLTASQTLATGNPGRFPRTTEIAADVRPGGFFGGAELVVEAGPDEVAARGAHGRFGWSEEPRVGSGEIWTADLGVTAGAGRPPFEPEQATMFETGFFADLALRIAGDGPTPGRLELARGGLHVVLGGRSRAWVAAEPPSGELAAAVGLRGSFDSDARGILGKAAKESLDALGLR